MSKKYKGKLCVYCATTASETADHVVAREFFPETDRKGLPKAPACRACNQRKSILEHRFTAVLPFGSDHELAKEMLTTRTRTRLDRNPGLRHGLQRGLRRVFVENNGQIASTISLPFEGDQFVRLCGYIIRGLIWHEWKHVVPATYYVEAIPVSDTGLAFFNHLLQMALQHRREAEFARGAFRYTCTRNSHDPAFSVWHVRLYDKLNLAGDDETGGLARVHICGLTGPEEVRDIMERFKGP